MTRPIFCHVILPRAPVLMSPVSLYPAFLMSLFIVPKVPEATWLILLPAFFQLSFLLRSGAHRFLGPEDVTAVLKELVSDIQDRPLPKVMSVATQGAQRPRVQELGFSASQLLSDYVSVDKPLSEAVCQLLIGANYDTRETHSLRTPSWPKLCSVHSVECN